MAASADPDTMRWHEAMKQPDREDFKRAAQEEWDGQYGNKNFSIIHKTEVPEGETVLPGVWAMRRKRDIKTSRVKKHKARWNVDGSKMVHGVHYDETYAPVASWATIRLILTIATVLKWKTTQLDYVMAYPQAPVERELYMRIPYGVKVPKGTKETHVLKLHKNVYGQKQAGRVWFEYLKKKLIEDVGFVQSKFDRCLFYKGSTVYVLYTDDSILAGPSQAEINETIAAIRKAGLKITDEGTIEDFLGVNIDRRPDGTIKYSQPHLIQQILKDVNMAGDNVVPKTTPAPSSRILHAHKNSKPFDESFHYRSIIGKIGYLEKGSRIDIAYINHQCARFCSDPKREHGAAIRWLCRYLKGTSKEGLIIKPDKTKGLEVHVDADFAGNWNPDETEDQATARSRHGYIISYAGCPVIWKSQLQTEIALSTTESEYTGLSYSLREAIPIMRLLREFKRNGIPVINEATPIQCRVFEDNSGALEMGRIDKYRPRTKHLNIKLHHFRSYVNNKRIKILRIASIDRPADIITKPLPEELLVKLHKQIWDGNDRKMTQSPIPK